MSDILFYGLWSAKQRAWLAYTPQYHPWESVPSNLPRRFAFKFEAEAVRTHELWPKSEWAVKPYVR